MKVIFIVAMVLALASFTDENRLTGKWESPPSEKGNVTSVVFRPDLTFDGFVNKKLFVTGTYKLNSDTFSMVDNGCEKKNNIYKLIFFHVEDSIRFKIIQDACEGRMVGMSKVVLGRVK